MRKILTLAILFCLAIGSTFAVSERIPDCYGYEAELLAYSSNEIYDSLVATKNYILDNELELELVEKLSKFQRQLVLNTLSLYETKAGEYYEFYITGPNVNYTLEIFMAKDDAYYGYLFVEKE